jgi:uncharacterized protein (DUF58 family)
MSSPTSEPAGKPIAVPPLDIGLLHELPSLELRSRYVMDGFLSGLHRSPKKGFSVEFADYRNYQPGDEIRRIDWRLYGRTDRLYMKEYEQESQLRAFLVLDTSASMAYSGRPGARMRKIDFARTILAALGLLALRQGDAFGMALVGAGLDAYLKPKCSQAQWRSVVSQMDSLHTGGTTGLATGLTALAELLPQRSLIVVASDFYEAPQAMAAALRRLRYDHHDVVGLQVLDSAEIELDEDWVGAWVDSETGERMDLDSVSIRGGYLKRFRAFLEQTQALFLTEGCDYSLERTDGSPMAALGSYLSHRARLH